MITGMEIRAKIDKIPVLSKFIGNSMLKFGLSEYQQFQVQLAVEEAVSNVITHGDLEEYDKITIKCQRKDNEVEIIIQDPGQPFDPTKVPKPDLKSSPLKRKPGGLGVYFVKKYMNKVNYEFKNDKNVLTLIKHI
ncbi:MAG: ATP-binding protein [Methanobacterium sp.]